MGVNESKEKNLFLIGATEQNPKLSRVPATTSITWNPSTWPHWSRCLDLVHTELKNNTVFSGPWLDLMLSQISAEKECFFGKMDSFHTTKSNVRQSRIELALLQCMPPEIPRKRFFQETIPTMLRWLTRSEELLAGFEFLIDGSQSLTLNQLQAACLLSHFFFDTLPVFPVPDLNMCHLGGLFTNRREKQEGAKLSCWLNYFYQITHVPEEELVKNKLMICRVALDTPPDWSTSNKLFCSLRVHPGSLDNAEGEIQVDFANKYIGGGVLSGGCVQEEIRFSVEPELSVSCALCPVLKDNEAIYFLGAERFSMTTGYAKDLRYSGPWNRYGRPKRRNGFLPNFLTAIDAADYRRGSVQSQYTKEHYNRELFKAYVGFIGPPSNAMWNGLSIATGNWGCGAFLGDPFFKSVLQWMAASEAGRPSMQYFTFSDPVQTVFLQFLSKEIAGKRTVGELYRIIQRWEQHRLTNGKLDFIRFLSQSLKFSF